MSVFYCRPRVSVDPQWKCKSCHDESQGVIFKTWLSCSSLLYSFFFFFHSGISIRALFSKETKVINTSTRTKQQYPLFCSQLTKGQKYLPNSVFQEPYSIHLIVAVKEHNHMCPFVKSHLGWIYRWRAVPQRCFSAFFLYLLVLETKYSWLGKRALSAFLHSAYLWNTECCGCHKD